MDVTKSLRTVTWTIISVSISWWEERKRGKYVTKQEREETETVTPFAHGMIHRLGL